ncbi:hypothetical protein KUTeg_005020 [Tegillarca granosa]|uniref:G-protein coupled receptors family 1 profile domain-containing protein n=1 Tax=Tegillarca granosa TaxID=220873 RepID=A0ABQ9FKC8_TEGGR|nr:hypothetical protein KUTeg_005020 [Tegillarca granosa]
MFLNKSKMNVSAVCDNIKLERGNYRVILPVVTILSVLALTGFIGNLTVIVVAIRHSNRQMKTYVFVVSLAVADLIVCFLCMPLAMLQQFTENQLVKEHVVFQLSISSDVMFSTVSILNLMCLTTDRYIAICHPLKYKVYMSWRNVVIMLLLCWIFSGVMSYGLILSGVHQIGADSPKEEGDSYCLLNVSFYYAVIGSGLGFYIPSIIITIFNIKVFYEIKKSSKYLQRLTCTTTLPKDKSIRKTEVRTAKTIAILMTCFFICWCPFFIYNVFEPLITTDIGDTILPYIIVMWLGYANSVLNPYLYLYLNKSKKDTGILCCTRCFKHQEMQISPQDNRVTKNSQRCNVKVLSFRRSHEKISTLDEAVCDDTRL